MKKKFVLWLTILSLIFASGCNIIENVMQSSAENEMVKSNLERDLAPNVDPSQLETLSRDNRTFAWAFYNEIRQGDGNIVFSPLSLSLALSMTLAGAETTTETAMLEALRLTLSEEQVYPAFNALLLAIEASQKETQTGDDEGYFQLNIANSLWTQAGYEFKQAFLDVIARNYGSGIYNVNFIQDPEGARKAINDWVAEETMDKITDLIPPGVINDLTRLVLANSIYFNGSWRYIFDPNDTAVKPFNLLDGSEINVDMMNLGSEYLGYTEGKNYKTVTLPYLSNDFAMTLLLPDSGQFASFEGSLDEERLGAILSDQNMAQIALQMPKFDFESTIDAKDALKALGMAEAFQDGKADFSGITNEEKLLITDVLHKATITVDEQGTEAAAATAVIVGLESMPSEPIPLVIDRPFLFVIQHRPTGTILFMGRVLEP
ncbi:MAG: serpin family protein [Anaerolineales bacterium]